MASDNLIVNEGKEELIAVRGSVYSRYAVRMPVVVNGDDPAELAERYLLPHLLPEDTAFFSEKMIACTQGRAIPVKDIRPRRLAVFLSSKVYKNPGGIGLAMPETMEMALRECGTARILFAAACHCVGRLLGRRGWFYRVAGRRAASIDGPCHCTIPPYNKYVVLGPSEPNKTAKRISSALGGALVLIVDINDLGGEILGSSKKVDKSLYREILSDNPLGQSAQSTPCGIIRKKI